MDLITVQRENGEWTGYLSDLLRLWQMRDGEAFVWRASLPGPAGAERLAFASLEGLLAYLRAEMEVP